jgi:peptidyl-prolyl cis-trans isomerase C
VRVAEAPAFEDVKADLAGQLQQKAVEDKVAALVAGSKVEKMVDGIDPAILKQSELLDQ